jgi:hypothetical protein
MRADPGSIRERLKGSTNQAWKLYCALNAVIPFKEAGRGQQISRQKLTASTIPWHGAAAGLVYDFYAEVRRLEVNLKAEVTGIRGVRRGGSDGNTRMALQSIVNFSHVVDDQTVLGVLGFVDRWIRQANAVFNPDLGLHRIPRTPGENDMRCPWCEYQTMRWQPATGIIVCINPECRNDSDERPRWRADYEIVGDEMRFTWNAFEGDSA